MSDSTPTQKLTTVVEGDAPKSRTLIYVLIGIGALLLIAVIALIVALLSSNATPAAAPSPTRTVSSTPSPTSSEPSATPTPTQTEAPVVDPAPAPAPTGARFKTFNAPSSESGCSTGGPGFPETRPLVKVSWSTAGADEAWFVMGTSDAADSGFMQIPLNGSQADFQYEQQFNCSGPSTTYTITLVAPDGSHVNKSWTVTNTGDQF